MEFLGLALALLWIAFFSGIEIAFVSANKLRIELLKEKGSTAAGIISNFNNNPSRFISAMLVGLNIGVVVFGTIAERYFTPERLGVDNPNPITWLVAQTVITTFIILLLGELIPKILFRVNSDQSLLIFAYPVQLFYWLLSPLAGLFHTLAHRIIRTTTGIEPTEGKPVFTKADLEYLVKETAIQDEVNGEEIDNLNSEIFEKALYLKDVKVRNCMVPRTEIQAIDVREPIEELRKMFVETKLSRLLVYEETIDHILGYVHHHDLLKQSDSIRSLIRPIQVVPVTMTARDLLLQFIRERKNIAWAVDEYGGTAGIITLEDLIEEIFGEIEDEHDTEELVEKRLTETEYIFSGRLEVDYLNNEYELDIPQGEYTTLSGYLIHAMEDIPEPGSTIDVDHFHIKVLRASHTRIELVHLRVRPRK
ncbi:MAG: hemolysin family protein [Chitinophagales bacterium]|nr:hemolysin family protein [Chitinophagales bacterium]MDW8418109.1 hemolysin family protein [Chitinophagales bacterium]